MWIYSYNDKYFTKNYLPLETETNWYGLFCWKIESKTEESMPDPIYCILIAYNEIAFSHDASFVQNTQE